MMSFPGFGNTCSHLDRDPEKMNSAFLDLHVVVPYLGQQVRPPMVSSPFKLTKRTLRKAWDIDIWVESSYILRRVELHGRELTDGQSPWSIRQVAVYHKWTSGAENSSKSNITKARIPQSTFLLIAPSLVAQRHMTRAVESANETGNDISTWYIHWFLIAESMGGWADYMAWLEKQLDEQVCFPVQKAIRLSDRNPTYFSHMYRLS